MKVDSLWKESYLETSDIFLAVVFGIALEGAISKAIYFVPEIEVPIVLGVVVIALVLKKYRPLTTFKTYSKFVLKSARWILGIWAGLLFTTGYSLVTLLPILGIPLSALFFFVVVQIIHYYKVVEKDKKEIGKQPIK